MRLGAAPAPGAAGEGRGRSAAINEFDQMTPVGRRTVPVNVPLTGTEEEFVYAVDVPFRGAKGAVAVAVQDQLGAEISYLRESFRLAGG